MRQPSVRHLFVMTLDALIACCYSNTLCVIIIKTLIFTLFHVFENHHHHHPYEQEQQHERRRTEKDEDKTATFREDSFSSSSSKAKIQSFSREKKRRRTKHDYENDVKNDAAYVLNLVRFKVVIVHSFRRPSRAFRTGTRNTFLLLLVYYIVPCRWFEWAFFFFFVVETEHWFR